MTVYEETMLHHILKLNYYEYVLSYDKDGYDPQSVTLSYSIFSPYVDGMYTDCNSFGPKESQIHNKFRVLKHVYGLKMTVNGEETELSDIMIEHSKGNAVGKIYNQCYEKSKGCKTDDITVFINKYNLHSDTRQTVSKI